MKGACPNGHALTKGTTGCPRCVAKQQRLTELAASLEVLNAQMADVLARTRVFMAKTVDPQLVTPLLEAIELNQEGAKVQAQIANHMGQAQVLYADLGLDFPLNN
jgi:hypothetical protein